MKKIIIGVFVAALLIQFIPYGKEHINLATVAEPQWDAPVTRELFMRGCGDCHSFESKWPWYSNIAPVSWLIQHDVEEGREHLNISAWGVQKKNKGDEAAEEFREGEMPMGIYTLIHSEAKFTQSERQLFLKGLVATFGEKKKSGDADHQE